MCRNGPQPGDAAYSRSVDDCIALDPLDMTPRKVILDCDPGHDDAIAILLAHGNPSLEIAAITTVGGNQTLDKVTRNARVVATLAGIQVPIAAGAEGPLVRPLQVGAEVHGETGMDGPTDLPEPAAALDPRRGAQVIVDTVMDHDPGEITLIPIGPLTNVALAARLEPRIVQRVREVVLMGGGLHAGNWSPVAEFNIRVDPEAAHVVFNAGWPVTMVGLDLTHQALATADVTRRIDALRTRPSRFVVQLIEFFAGSYRRAQGFEAPPVHDACAVARVIDPTIVEVERMPIDVELSGALTLGMTVADGRTPAPETCRTFAALRLDRARFWDLVVDALRTIGEGGAA
jgi:purine nucleosidase